MVGGMTQLAVHLVVADPHSAAWYTQALAAGATEFAPLHDAFWGDRTGQLLGPSGHRWALGRHVRDVPAEEIARQAAALFDGSVNS
jgi:PhnB protein